jgi:histidinol-phosphate aminotransferase
MTDTRTTLRDSSGGGARPRRLLESVSLYLPDDAPCAVDLSDNTNLWGMPPAAEREVRSLSSGAVARYPTTYSERLRQALARHCSVSPDMVVTGCGSDDLLDATIRAFGEPGSTLAHIDPTFTMIPTFARINGVVPRAVPITSAYDVDVSALVAGDPSIVYLCSPNNPTGTSLTRETIVRTIDESRCIVIVDEAYAEFAGRSVVDLLARSDRLLISRTFSKAYGLAGLRVGYMLGASPAIAAITKVRGPYKVNAVGERAAFAALVEDQEWVTARVADAIGIRVRLLDALRALGLQPLPSSANFVLVPVHMAPDVAAAMRKNGVLVRTFSNLPPVDPALLASDGAALRIGVAPWDQMSIAIDAFRDALATCA